VHAALDRPGREGVAAVVDPAVLEPGRPQRRRPFAVTEPLDVDVAAADRRNEDLRVDPLRCTSSASSTRPRSGIAPGTTDHPLEAGFAYFNTSTGAVRVYDGSAWNSISGDGATWYTDSGDPSTTHNGGDFYLDSATGEVWKQVSGSWVDQSFTLKGDTGSVGSGAAADGWVDASETWTYSSADGPTGVFTVAADVTGRYSPGMRVKLTQTTVKYFIITVVSTFTGGNTTITVYGGTDYTLANAVSANYYSTSRAPFGFPALKSKWTVLVTDTSSRTQSSPVRNTWYNVGSLTISVPIGAWELEYGAVLRMQSTTARSILYGRITLSTANNTESDSQLSHASDIESSGSTFTFQYFPVYRMKQITVAAKTSYFLNVNTPSGGALTNIGVDGSSGGAPTVIRAICAYL
jgi:hypothetical protein